MNTKNEKQLNKHEKKRDKGEKYDTDTKNSMYMTKEDELKNKHPKMNEKKYHKDKVEYESTTTESDSDDERKRIDKMKQKKKKYKNDDVRTESDEEKMYVKDKQRDRKSDESNIKSSDRTLMDPSKIGEKLLSMNSPDYAAHAIVESVMINVKRETEINLMNQELLMNITPANEWKIETLLTKVEQVKCVKEIPRLISIISTHDSTNDDFSALVKEAGISLNSEYLNECVAQFRAGTLNVKFVISTKNTLNSIEYDPEVEYKSMFDLEGYKLVTGEKNFFGDSDLQTFSSLLTLIFEVKDVANVAVVDPVCEIFIDRDDGVYTGPLMTIKGKKIPRMSVPHVLLGTYKHPLRWFTDVIRDVVAYNKVIFGEFGNVEMDAANNKLSSYYAVTMDNFCADLYELHQQKLESQIAKPSDIINIMNAYTPRGTRVKLLTDSRLNYSRAFFPNNVNAQQYTFSFLLFQPVRMSVRARLEQLITDTRGLHHVGFNEMAKLLYTTVPIPNSDTSLDKIFMGGAERLSLRHFYQMMVINKMHAFVNAEGVFPFQCTTVYHAVSALLYTLVDALIFPSYFWTNIHIYLYTIYKAIEQLDPKAYNLLIDGKFTKSYDLPREITRVDILNGEIPKICTNRQLPGIVNTYMQLLAPIGVLVDNGNGTDAIADISEQRKTYIPFKQVRRSTVETVNDTMFADRIRRFKDLINTVIKSIARKELSGVIITTNLSSQLMGVLNAIHNTSKRFGATAHYELEALYRTLHIGPEVPYETYYGEAKVNLSPPIGLVSNVDSSQRPIMSYDVVKVFPGVGMYALMTIVGDHISKSGSGKVDLKASATYMHKNTIDRVNEHIIMVKSVEYMSEQFGILTHIIRASRDPTDPWSIFFKMFGRTFKSGLATQVLEKLLKVSNIKEMTERLIDEDRIASLDLRLNEARVCDVTVSGQAINDKPHINKYFNQPFELLSPFEKQKLEIALELISGDNSPMHRYVKGLSVRRQAFVEMSPENRHDEPDDVVEFNYDNFIYEVVDGNSYFGIMYLDQFFYSVTQEGFPRNIGVDIVNTALITTNEEWNFLSACVEGAEWTLMFNLRARAVVRKVPKEYLTRDMIGWEFLKEAIAGTTVIATFYDTYDPSTNYKTHVTRGEYWQYVCAYDPVERNVLIKDIKGIVMSPNFMQIDEDNWVLGNCVPGELSRASNNHPKYKLGKVNFNNLVKVWTKNVDFNTYPRMVFGNINDNSL